MFSKLLVVIMLVICTCVKSFCCTLYTHSVICQLYLNKTWGGTCQYTYKYTHTRTHTHTHTHTVGTETELIEFLKRQSDVTSSKNNSSLLSPFPSINRGFTVTMNQALNCELRGQI